MVNKGPVDAYLEEMRKEVSLQDEVDVERVRENFRIKLDNLGVPKTPQREQALEEAARILERELSGQQQPADPLDALIRARRDWYSESNTQQGIRFPRYLEYLQKQGWETESLKESTRRIVGYLANPAEPESFPCKGLVVGHVQSGKTANMMGVIARAVDAGYNFVIILAGTTDSLRDQTQQRIENDLIKRTAIGNWLLLTRRNKYDSLGNLVESGEFQFVNRNITPSRDLIFLAVIKKNQAPLKRLIGDVSEMTPLQKARLRALVIDDEADQASPNAGDSDEDPTVINGLIRKLLRELNFVSYVGYTATPFANVLINPFPSATSRQSEKEDKLDDLYPKDFIVALHTPPDYFGTERLFGRYSADPDDPSVDGLDFLRDIGVDEVGRLLPQSREEADTFQPEMTPSLESALKWYLLSCAARLHRGHESQHMSMLVHTSMRTNLHSRTKKIIDEYIEDLRPRIHNEDPDEFQKLKELWEREQSIVPKEIRKEKDNFERIVEFIPIVLERLAVVEMNVIGRERPDYTGAPRCWIVVGGNILARGLTLDGLSTSYFLRTSRQYDTLLQMGRWFGYRKGYEDLQRIWMTRAMQENFRQLALVEQEIRDEIEEYARRGATPLDFAVRIRTLPGLAVTAPGKMRHAVTADIDFGGQHLQTIRFLREDREWLERNWEAGSRLLQSLVERGLEMEHARGNLLWRQVPTEDILHFLEMYRVDDSFRSYREGWIRKYIEKNAENYRNGWNVAVIQPSRDITGRRGMRLGPVEAPALVNRSRLAHADKRLADIKALMSKRDILVDVDKEEEESGGGPSDRWDSIKIWREQKVGGVPLLLLYPIDRESQPRFNASIREPLDAAHDVLGIGLVFPSMGWGLKARTKRIQVRLEPPIDADFIDQLEEGAS